MSSSVGPPCSSSPTPLVWLTGSYLVRRFSFLFPLPPLPLTSSHYQHDSFYCAHYVLLHFHLLSPLAGSLFSVPFLFIANSSSLKPHIKSHLLQAASWTSPCGKRCLVLYAPTAPCASPILGLITTPHPTRTPACLEVYIPHQRNHDTLVHSYISGPWHRVGAP